MTTSHKSGIIICKAGGKTQPAQVNINSNGLVVCKQWRKCPEHGKPECEELGMHEETLEIIKQRRNKQ